MPHPIQIPYDPSEVALERYLDTIALEAQFLSNMLEIFKKVIPSFSDKLKRSHQVISGIMDDSKKLNDDLSLLSKKERQIIEVTRELDFLVYGEKLTLVPENFTGHFPTYLKVLTDVSEKSSVFVSKVVSDYTAMLSSFITNKDAKNTIAPLYPGHHFMDPNDKGMPKSIVQFTAPLKPYFKSNTGKTRVKLKSVLHRFADLHPMFIEANKLSKIQTYSRMDNLNQKVKATIDLLDIIVNMAKKGDVTQISPEATDNIAKMTYEVAKLVEFSSINYFDTVVALNTVDFIGKDLLSLVPEKK